MTVLTVPELFAILVVSIAAALAVIWLLALRARPAPATTVSPSSSAHVSTFLFHGDFLTDHDIPTSPDHPCLMDTISDWSDLRSLLAKSFDGLPDRLDNLPRSTSQTFKAQVNGSTFLLCLHRSDSATRLELRSVSSTAAFTRFNELLRASAAADALTILDLNPLPLWKTDSAGDVVWRNSSASEIEAALGGPPCPDGKDSRFCVSEPDGDQPHWYELAERPLGEGKLLWATNVTQVLHAESAQRDFVQTLTKTFAHLTTGLAVFDKNRQLALFNPALVDLSGLPVAFLSARPDVIRFFDELRERQVLPEPKNYSDWRDQIRDVIAQAHDGTYSETWNLPAGVTYRVTGRPHPDGAVAFLFQDISAEIMQTRTFRSQLDLSQRVIDGLEEAIVVISSSNLVLMCNAAGSDLLGIDPSAAFADMSLHDLVKACRVRFAGDALWTVFEADLRDGAAHEDGPGRYLTATSGQRLRYRIKPLSGGARLLSFSTLPEISKTAPASAAE